MNRLYHSVMIDLSVKRRLYSLAALFLTVVFVWWSPPTAATDSSPYLKVSFLDVGQGDSILIQTPDGVRALIDGGRDSKVLSRLSEELTSNTKHLDMVVGTHPDSDHIGGLVGVLQNYKVDTILVTENKGDSKTAKEYQSLVEKEGAEVVHARRGQIFSLGASTTMEVLWPETDPSNLESNTSSIVVRVAYGDTSFVLTGDAPKQVEEYLVLAYGEHLESTVLKLGHHGSRTSTSEMFLDEVMPEYAVISAGRNNSYGHPHVEVTDMLFNKRIETHSTAEEGTVTFFSDGGKVWFK